MQPNVCLSNVLSSGSDAHVSCAQQVSFQRGEGRGMAVRTMDSNQWDVAPQLKETMCFLVLVSRQFDNHLCDFLTCNRGDVTPGLTKDCTTLVACPAPSRENTPLRPPHNNSVHCSF